MEARNAEVVLLTYAKDRALEIVNSYEEQDKFLILTHDLEAKHQRYVDQQTAIAFIEDVHISPEVENLEDIMNVASRIRATQEDLTHQMYILSDFQENISVFSAPRDTSTTIYLLPFRAVQESNVAIVDAKWDAPIAMNNTSNSLILELHNYGDQLEEVELRMTFEEQERPLGTVQLRARSSTYDTVNVSVNNTGWHQISFHIEDYPIDFDNHLFAAFNINERIDVLSIYEDRPNTYITSAFESIEYYNLNQYPVNGIRYELFQDQELIILNDLNNISSGLSSELIKYVENGGNVLVFPSIQANIDSYNSLLGSLNADRLNELIQGERNEVGSINTEEFVFNDVFVGANRNIRLPSSNDKFTLSSSQSSGREWLLRYRDGNPYLTKNVNGTGNVYLCAAPLSDSHSDLVRNAEIFVPMLYKMALSKGKRVPLYYTIGEDDVVAIARITNAQSERYLMTGPIEFIPGITNTKNATFMDVRGQISDAGFYQLINEGNIVYNFGFNFDRKESDVIYKDMNQISDELGDKSVVLNDIALAGLGDYITEQNEGIRLWRWCLILGLIFLLIETLLIRFWK